MPKPNKTQESKTQPDPTKVTDAKNVSRFAAIRFDSLAQEHYGKFKFKVEKLADNAELKLKPSNELMHAITKLEEFHFWLN